MANSPDKVLLFSRLTILCVSILVLIFTIRVNQFTEWFYKADLFPFGLSIATIIVFGILFITDHLIKNPTIRSAQVHLPVLLLLSLLWLSFNIFTTSRYVNVPYTCSTTIPGDIPALQAWCINVQLVKSFIWINWAVITFFFIWVVRFVRNAKRIGLTAKLDDVGNGMATAYPFAPDIISQSMPRLTISNPRPLTGESDYLKHLDSIPENTSSHLTSNPSSDYPNPHSNLRSPDSVEGGTGSIYYVEASGLTRSPPEKGHYIKHSSFMHAL